MSPGGRRAIPIQLWMLDGNTHLMSAYCVRALCKPRCKGGGICSRWTEETTEVRRRKVTQSGALGQGDAEVSRW